MHGIVVVNLDLFKPSFYIRVMYCNSRVILTAYLCVHSIIIYMHMHIFYHIISLNTSFIAYSISCNSFLIISQTCAIYNIYEKKYYSQNFSK